METNQLLNLTTFQLRRAADIKEQIDQLTDELGQVLSGGNAETRPATPIRTGGRRQISAEGRRKIAEAARARWAKVRAAKGTAGNNDGKSDSAKKKRTMSPAARKKIAEAAKARWAKVRAAKN